MKLKSFISVIDADEEIYIHDGENTLFAGTVRDAYSDLPENIMENARVITVHTCIGGIYGSIYIEVSP